MKMKMTAIASGCAAFALIAFGGAGAQTRSGGTVDYWMSAETMSGMGGMGSQGADAGAMMRNMMSGGASADTASTRALRLQIGSPRRPAAAPAAEHLPPQALGTGPSLPLETRPPSASEPGQFGDLRGRIQIYWGCGDRVRTGQPFEIDLSRIAAGQAPALAGLPFQPMNPPSPGRFPVYGEWPNSRGRATRIPGNGSLVGDHVVRGNYTPDIRFTLAQGQDFMAPLAVTTNQAAASGAVPIAWRPVPDARGYFLVTTGARADGTIIFWSSSEVQFSHIALDYLSEGEVARLIRERVVLSPQTTRCTVPAEVARAVEANGLQVIAFGPEANFSYPARPANAPRGWTPDWTVKLRTRSAHVGILGMDMAAMMGGEDSSSGRPTHGRQEQPRRRRSIGDMFRDRILGQ
jgi:hypothetical protein